jgi:hypothetical protein
MSTWPPCRERGRERETLPSVQGGTRNWPTRVSTCVTPPGWVVDDDTVSGGEREAQAAHLAGQQRQGAGADTRSPFSST